MDHLARGQNPVPAEGVTQAALGDQIDFPTENRSEFVDHVHPVKQVQAVARRKLAPGGPWQERP